jgi:hypothetical protein
MMTLRTRLMRPPPALLQIWIALLLCAIAPRAAASINFALIGDFGSGGPEETAVADRIKSYAPDFVVTLGDNNYLSGSVTDMDRAVGRDYHAFIKYPANSTSQYAATGASQINFYPLVGNHDWDAGIDNHSSYYTFPQANTRYYDFVRGPVHFFMLDSDDREPDGNTATSVQADWLRAKLAASTDHWNLVLLHHAPYSSSGGTTALRWPFHTWGAHAVLSGHSHNYEHLLVDGETYLVNGLGGEEIQTGARTDPNSRFFYDADYAFLLATADDDSLQIRLITRAGQTIDNTFWQHDTLVPTNPEPTTALFLLALVSLRRAPNPRRLRLRAPGFLQR